MPKMIIHTPTRIVRRMTTDPSHFTAADETTEDVADGMDIGGGPWKLSVNAKSLLTPTLAEIEAEKATVYSQSYQDFFNACLAIEGDPIISDRVKRLAQTLRIIMTSLSRGE